MEAALASATVAFNLARPGTVSMNASLTRDSIDLIQEQRRWS